MRRWLFRILIGVAIAIVAVVVIVQIVLWTPLPKRIVTQQIEKELGLRISTANLSTGWLGNSELTDVSLGLPLSTGDFLKVKRLKIKHSSLIGLALGNVDVDSIEIDDPQVNVLQDANGEWNLQQVFVLLGRLGGSNAAQNQSTSNTSSGGGPVPKLPNIRLNNGSVHITDNQHHSVDLAPLNITGESTGLLVWNYKLTIADSIAMTGKLAPGGNWQHQITLAAKNLDPLLKGWGAPNTYSANVKSQWDGQLTDGKLTGTLTLQQATAAKVPTLGDVQLTGAVDAVVDGAVITLRPNHLNLTTTLLALPKAGITSGTILYDPSGVHAQALTVRALGGLSTVDASFDPRTLATDVHARWSGLSLAKQTIQNGSLNAQLRLPFAGQPVITMDLQDTGTAGAPTNRWAAKLNLTGQGRSWQNIDWVLTAPQLVYSTKSQSIDLSQLSAHVSQHLPVVELTSLSLPASGSTSANFSSTGRADFQSMHWNFDASGGFNTTFQNTPVPMNIDLHTSGTNERFDLKKLVLGFADLTFTVDGSYDTTSPKPMDLHIQLAQTPRVVPDSPVQGEVNGEFNIDGLLFRENQHFRPYLTITGDLRSNDLVLFNRPIGDIDIKLAGSTRTPNLQGEEPGPSITEIHTVDFKLFEAPWDLSINCPNAQGNLQAVLQTRRLPLEELARFARQKGITGEAGAKVSVVMSSDSLRDLDLQSDVHLTDVNLKGVTADTVDATVTLKDGQLKLNPLIARSGSGTVTTTGAIDLQNARHLVTETTVDRWPYSLSGSVSALVSAHTKLDLDVKAKDLGANGTLTASTDLLLGEKTKLGHADLAATVLDRTLSIDQVTGKIINGTFNGAGKFDFDKPLQALGQVTCENIDGAAIAAIFPGADGLAGKYSLAITLAPARDPRPLEPVRMDINIASTNAHFRSMQIGDGSLLTLHGVSYLNVDRAVLDHSDLYMAGGVAHIWGRVSYRPNARLATQAAVDFEHFQLDQLAHIDPLLTKPIPGILDGHIGIIRSGPHSSQVLAQAHIGLTQTDLGNFGPLAALYSVMHFGSSSTGYGTVDLGFQQDVLHITDFHFFNSGLEARGLCSVGPIDYTTPLNTKIGGQLVGTLRPLKDIKLPFVSDFDQAFNAFEGNLTAIDLVGTLNHPAYPPALIGNLGKTLRQLLVGEAEGRTQ